MGSKTLRPARGLMALAALTLLGASAVHFGVTIPLGLVTLRDPFPGAAIPELVLGLILGGGAAAAIVDARSARAIGIGTTVFAILVVLYGMSVTLRSGRVGDVTYHSILLLMLLLAGAMLSLRR